MSGSHVAPFGAWASPISAAMLASGGVELGQTWLDDGVAYWSEGRPAEGGRTVIVRGDPYSSPRDVTPEGFNVRTMAHEYGGGAFSVHRGVVFCARFEDQRLYRQDPGAAPFPITPDVPDRVWRFADGRVTHDGAWWIGVRERHDLGPKVADVVNELVAVPTDGSLEPRTIAGGRDFYSNPVISPDGTRLAYLSWMLPWMPWDGNELVVADVASDGTLSTPTVVAGRDGEESIWQPSWAPDGSLLFASDRSGWWNLERWDGSARSPLHPAEAEFGYPQWVFGLRSFGSLSDGRIVCLYDTAARTHVAVLDPSSGELLDLDLPYDAIYGDPCLSVEGTVAVCVLGSATAPDRVLWMDFATRGVEELRVSQDVEVDAAYLSQPRAIEFPTEDDLTAHAFFYPPRNPEAEGPEGERPPLIVIAHGGPTSHTTSSLDLGIQFWTSRGFAVVDVNYGGSTGYGRAYRRRLNGNWGVVDLQDCVNAARYLVEEGEVDGRKLLVRGGSAGGYVVMCALTFTDVFAAGASYFGIADLEPFATGDTHKFESKYEHTMVGPYPEEAERYRERSPIRAVDRLATPMLVLQGADDEVVPPSQAEIIVGALRAKNLPHAYLLFEGEGHGFRRADTIVRSREAELSFYAQILGFEPGGEVPRLSIEHLPEPG
jgi:dipeptidyl aminopeptidase/acylaminoacyl peptidase